MGVFFFSRDRMLQAQIQLVEFGEDLFGRFFPEIGCSKRRSAGKFLDYFGNVGISVDRHFSSRLLASTMITAGIRDPDGVSVEGQSFEYIAASLTLPTVCLSVCLVGGWIRMGGPSGAP